MARQNVKRIWRPDWQICSYRPPCLNKRDIYRLPDTTEADIYWGRQYQVSRTHRHPECQAGAGAACLMAGPDHTETAGSGS